MARPKRLSLQHIRWQGPMLHARYDVDGHPFSTTLWYGDVDLDALERRLGAEAMHRLAFHVAAFELNKLASLDPVELTFGPWSRFVTTRFVELWRTVLVKVWAEWRWRHDRPDWQGPRLLDEPNDAPPCPAPLPLADAGDEVLLLFGGGKDSLVAADLLDRAGVGWSSLAYAHAVYGPPAPQHALIDGLLDALSPRRRHRQWVADDAFAAPIAALVTGDDAADLVAAETPASIFGALPVVLARGYRRMALAHEHSANKGNLIWEVTGEDVNHQWGKSWQAEQLLSRYVEDELVSGFHWFSVLQPIGDVLIFELLRGRPDAVPRTHSCNVKKPWCRRCPKCAYVALGYAAHLQDGLYEQVFAEDVLDLPENELAFRQLMGLEAHTPFECVGEIDEARLALALCAARGRRSRAVELFRREGGALDLDAILARHAVVHDDAPHGLPSNLGAETLRVMRAAQASAEERIRATLALGHSAS